MFKIAVDPRRHAVPVFCAALGVAAAALAVWLPEGPAPRTALGAGAAATLLALAASVVIARRRSAAMRLALRMSRRLADQGERFRALVEEAPHCTLVCDADTTIRYASQPLRRLLGHDADAAPGRRLDAWLAPEDLPALHIALARARAGAAAPLLARLRHADAGWRWIEAHLHDASDRAAVDGIVLVCIDVTEREQSRRELAQTRERLDIALVGARMALWELHVPSGEIRLSAQWSQLLGAADAVPVTTRLVALSENVHSADLHRVREAFSRVLDGSSAAYRAEHRVRAEDGRWLWIESTGHVVERGRDGRPLRLAGVNIEVTEQRQTQAQIADLALHDSLTDLPNRALLADRLTQALAHAARRGEAAALALIDIHRFDHVNRAFGHEAGDTLLCEVADRLRAALRHGETLARLGGDKFAVALPGVAGADAAAALAQSLLQALAAPVAIDGQPHAVEACVGVAIYPGDGSDAAALLRSADIALAQAKALGASSIQFCDARASERARRRLMLERDLAGASQRGELWLAYQPLIDMASRRIVGAEALLRWRHATEGDVEPAEFIPIAEASGQIGALGRWTLAASCAQARAWQLGGAPGFVLSVNLSPHQLREPDLVGDIRALLQRSPLAPGTLELEVTESVFADDEADMVGTLRRLKSDAGVRLAIDDFGTGYSSLARLRQLPVDRLKIDRAFVRGVASDDTDAAMVGSILAVARAIGLDVTVEGVETEAQVARLSELGCTRAQGYGLGRPMSAEELTRRLAPAAA